MDIDSASNRPFPEDPHQNGRHTISICGSADILEPRSQPLSFSTTQFSTVYVEVLKGSTQRWGHRNLLWNWVSNLLAIATYVRVSLPFKGGGEGCM